MKSCPRFGFNAFVLMVVGAAVALPLRNAAAQHYDGCFVNGQQVADSMCAGGGGGGGGSSMMSNPAFGALSSMSFALGAALGTAVRNSLQPAPNNAPAPQASAPAARAAPQGRYQFEQQNARAEAERQQREFRASQRTLISEMRGVDGSPADAGSRQPAASPPDMGMGLRQLDGTAAAPSPPPTRSATLRVVNQTDSDVTVSVDGAYGCNTAGGTTCLIPVTTGHHDLRAVRTDTGAVFTESVDIPGDGLVWPLTGT